MPAPGKYLASRLGGRAFTAAHIMASSYALAATRFFSAITGLLWRGLLMLAVVGLGVALWWQQSQAPQRHQLEVAELRLLPGQQAVLGRRELVAPAADEQHVRIWRDAAGQWGLSNLSPSRAVAWRQGERKGQLRQAPLVAGQALWVAGLPWQVLATQPTLELELQPQGQAATRWRYTGGQLLPITPSGPGGALPQCPGAAWSVRLRHVWNQYAPASLRRPAALQWGGTWACGTHLPLPALEVGALQIVPREGQFFLQGSHEVTRQVCLQALQDHTCPTGATLFEQALPLAGVSYLTLGRTLFALSLHDDVLRLAPQSRGGWLTASTEPPLVQLPGAPAGVSALGWRTVAFDPWRWPARMPPLTSAALGLAVAALWAGWRHFMRHEPQMLALAQGLGGVMALASLALYGVGAGVGPLLSLVWVGVALLLGVAWLPGATGWVGCSHAGLAVMLMAGLAMQWQLGTQGADAGAWGYLQKTAALASAGFYALLFVAAALHARLRVRRPRALPGLGHWEWLLVLLMLVALVLLGLQVLFGGEEGVFGIQPVELAKLALVLSGAHALALRMEHLHVRGLGQRLQLWLWMALPVVLFMALAALALLLVQDYSPLLLMGAWLLGLLLAWWLATGSWMGALLALGLIGTAAGGWYWLNMGQGVAWMQAHGFYGERFAVWLDPLLHPHNGEQVLRAMQLAGKGNWLGNAQAAAWRVPAVQDDMAPAFFTGRFGLVAAWGLWAVQCAYVGCLLMLGWRALQAERVADHYLRWALRLVFFAAWGAAALFGGHLVLSWGTNTGWLPVMGQPMPLLSAGGSVIVLLLVPLHLLWQLQPGLLQGPRQGRA